MEKLTNELNSAVAKVSETKTALAVAEAGRDAAAKAHEDAVKDATSAYNAVKNYVKDLVPGVGSAPRVV